jgi:hypothetical protein
MDDKKHELIEVGVGEVIEFTYNIICNCAEIHIKDKVIRIDRGNMIWLCEEFLKQYGNKKEDVYKGKYEQLVFKYADLTQKFADFLMSGKKN